MNMRMIEQYHARQRRKRALVISLIIHGIFVIGVAVWLLKPIIEEIEDRITIDIIGVSEQQVQVPKKQVVKKSEANTPVKQAAKRSEVRRKSTAAAPLSSPAAKRLSPSMSALPKVVMADPKLEPPDASTLANLTPEPDSFLVPGAPDVDVARGSGEAVSGSGISRRKGQGTGNKPGRGRGGAGRGLGDAVKGGFKGQDDFGEGIGEGDGDGTGAGDGDGTGAETFESLMKTLGEEIAETSGGAPIDVVFVVDMSGSMTDNIRSVTEHIQDMLDVYKAVEIPYALGLTEFFATMPKGSQGTQNSTNKITVTQLVEDDKKYKRTLEEINVNVTGDENALDAIMQTLKGLRFRPISKRHLIVLTDEPFTSLTGVTIDKVIAACKEFDIRVNVIGLSIADHKRLAAETGGKWHPIPYDDPPPTAVAQPSSRLSGSISGNVLQRSIHVPVDVILFVDGSKSMEDKLPHFLKELDAFVRDWDNGLIDYQIGVVRFRHRETVNMINVFQPPQTLDEVRGIVGLPCDGDEMLLDAVAEGMRKVKTRPNAQRHFILVTDEPAKGKYSSAATINMLEQAGISVSVIGTVDDFQQQVAAKTGGVWKAIPGGSKSDSSYH